MQVNVMGRGLSGSTVLDVEGQVRRALATASDQINGVCVRLDRVCDGRAAGQERCRIVVWLRCLRTVVVEARHPDLAVAVEDAAARAREAAWRHLRQRPAPRLSYADRLLSLGIA